MDVSSSKIDIYGKTFEKLNSLRLLNFYIGSWDNLRDVNGKIRENKLVLETTVNAISGRLEYLSSELRLFCWHGFPFPELPLTFYPENLVILDLSYSYCWTRFNVLDAKTSSGNLNPYKAPSHCRNLIKTPDFAETPNLEELILDGCESLTEVNPSVVTLTSLIVLNLRNCTSLVSPPSCTGLKCVQILNLSGCKKLNKFPEDLGNMKALMELRADGTRIDELPYCLSSLGNLQVFTLGQREEMQTKSWGSVLWPSFTLSSIVHPPSAVFPSLSGLRFLRDIDVSHCNLIEASLDGIECLSMLQTLNLSGNDFRSLPSFGKLFRLETLGLGRIDPYKLVSVILPGSSIPGWFSNQNNGDSVKVELPTDWCYEKFKGIAFCLVFCSKRRNGRKSSYGSIGYRFKNFDGTPIGVESPIPDSIFQYEYIGIKSDQMLLSYHQSELDWKKAKNFITVAFDIYGADCVVKMCGARLVYEDDEQQQEGRPGSRMIQWLPPPSQDEDEPPVKKRHVSQSY
ncbi:disease resistance protein (TIR-NBS-LRR class) family [Artemisia annua]|uniref:Disease resistance protein (TIR-NBS-LRR class) family n=1 Tax=Artemisia annua TaxID=35608 RepID=A0A2U1N6G8_ARTAN|nr:disease resistance protein (TIR-NBS-LRR class) family [Artemisia annua]